MEYCMVCERIDLTKNGKNPYFVKVNYELLGAGCGVHMHWHLFPRRKGDTETGGSVWKLGSELVAEEFLPTPEELEDLKTRLRIELDKLLEKEK